MDTNAAQLVALVRQIQTTLTEHMSPVGPSKAETIEKLNDLALGPRMTAALVEIGVPA